MKLQRREQPRRDAETEIRNFRPTGSRYRTWRFLASLPAVSEVFGWHEGVVTAYGIDRATGTLTYINKQATRGNIVVHVSLDATGRWLFVANYLLGPGGARPPQAVAVLPVEHDGGIGAPVATVAHQGSGPNAARQEMPHPHCAVPSPDNRHVPVPDLGIDQVRTYRFDAGDGMLNLVHTANLPPGAGPSLAFHPNGRFAYVTLNWATRWPHSRGTQRGRRSSGKSRGRCRWGGRAKAPAQTSSSPRMGDTSMSRIAATTASPCSRSSRQAGS